MKTDFKKHTSLDPIKISTFFLKIYSTDRLLSEKAKKNICPLISAPVCKLRESKSITLNEWN